MSTYITLDGGTTSTRLSLVRDGNVCDRIKLDIGVRSCIDRREDYFAALKQAISEILLRNAATAERIIASGMVTCEFGLCNLPHIGVPAGIDELHGRMHETVISEISEIPFVFIRGVKTDSEDVADFDMMRGEETELMGILGDYGDCLYILPGSHSKHIQTDKNGRIVRFSTMLTGEMIFALSQDTILKDAVDLKTEKIDEEYLLKGYETALRCGVNKTLFKVRVLKNIFGCSKEQAYSFFMGAVLCDEISAITESEVPTVVLGGRMQIKRAMALILRSVTAKTVIELDEKMVDESTAIGAVRVYEHR